MYDALQPQIMVNWREILNVLTAKTGKVSETCIFAILATEKLAYLSLIVFVCILTLHFVKESI